MESDTPPELWQTISQHWQSLGITNPPGATDAEIDAFERNHGVRLPTGIREFYSHVDGMSLGEWDESLIRFWPLSEWYSVPVLSLLCRGIPDFGGIENFLPDAASYFVFADHSISIHVYAVRLTRDPLRHARWSTFPAANIGECNPHRSWSSCKRMRRIRGMCSCRSWHGSRLPKIAAIGDMPRLAIRQTRSVD